MNFIFASLKTSKNMNFIFASLNNVKKHEFLFCKLKKPQKTWISFFASLTSLRGAHGVGRGDGAPLGLFFLGYVYDSELEEASDVVDQCCSCNWRCYDEKRIFEYIYCFWYIFEIHNGYVKNRRASLDWQSFFEMKILKKSQGVKYFCRGNK